MKHHKISDALMIGDLHCPYHHPDAFEFLGELSAKFKFQLVLLMGDEIDGHAISFHDSKDPDLFSPGHELQNAILALKDLYVIFPHAKILDSNHGSLYMRKIKHAGLPISVLKPIHEILEAPKNWQWVPELYLKLPDGSTLYAHHGKTGVPLKMARLMECHTAQGHFHTKSGIQSMTMFRNHEHKGVSLQRFWCMYTGCLINDKSLAYHYNKLGIDRPMLSCGGLLDGRPVIFPMLLNARGRWTGKVQVVYGQ